MPNANSLPSPQLAPFETDGIRNFQNSSFQPQFSTNFPRLSRLFRWSIFRRSRRKENSWAVVRKCPSELILEASVIEVVAFELKPLFRSD